MTIRKRLTLWYAGLVTAIILIFGVIVFGALRVTMIANIDNTLTETTRLIRANSQLVVVNALGQDSSIQADLSTLDIFRASGIEVQMWIRPTRDEAFRLIDSSLNLRDYPDPLDEGHIGSDSQVFSDVNQNGVTWRVLTSPILANNNNAIGINGRLVGNLQVAASMQPVNQAINEMVKVLAVICIATIGASVLLSMWLSDRMLQPIENITAGAARIAGTKDLSTRLPWTGPNDELGKLTSVFNQMMGRIEHLFNVQQRFIADISHELRTPLTGIRGNVDMIKRYGVDDESLNAIFAESERMSRLVNDLLLLARADYGGMSVDLYPLDLDSIVMEVFQQARGLVGKRDLQFKLEHIEPLRVNGNSDRIKQMVLNLIDNALKFTPDDGKITLGLRRQNDYAVITVTDTGIGIDADSLERIFDRFYQSDPARTHTGGGFGLGLSISKWIVEAHGGSIYVESKPNVETKFTVQIPLYYPPGEEPTINFTEHAQVTRPRINVIRRN